MASIITKASCSDSTVKYMTKHNFKFYINTFFFPHLFLGWTKGANADECQGKH